MHVTCFSLSVANYALLLKSFVYVGKFYYFVKSFQYVENFLRF